MARIVPSNYSKLKGIQTLSKEEEFFIDMVRDALGEDIVAVVQLISFPEEKEKYLMVLISKENGLVFIEATEGDYITKKTIETYSKYLLKTATKKIASKLAGHRQLAIMHDYHQHLQCSVDHQP